MKINRFVTLFVLACTILPVRFADASDCDENVLNKSSVQGQFTISSRETIWNLDEISNEEIKKRGWEFKKSSTSSIFDSVIYSYIDENLSEVFDIKKESVLERTEYKIFSSTLTLRTEESVKPNNFVDVTLFGPVIYKGKLYFFRALSTSIPSYEEEKIISAIEKRVQSILECLL
ncbi:hypothetical protein [Bowmanella denitrificans]|uniref:hypothetical protein n=1 Tax=Bowmanella denitrificans TaxID=366582 RepID=UPI000C99EA24|nr:hypothetical protein [Bowmanella denitrificans]